MYSESDAIRMHEQEVVSSALNNVQVFCDFRAEAKSNVTDDEYTHLTDSWSGGVESSHISKVGSS